MITTNHTLHMRRLNLLAITGITVIVLLVAMVTAPETDTCIEKVVSNDTGISLVNEFIPQAGRMVYTVKDCILFKVVVNRLTGKTVEVGFFNHVICIQ